MPHVAWEENGGVGQEIRVSQLHPSGDFWQQIVGGASPINADPDDNGNYANWR